MEDHNSFEEITKRAAQENPIVMYLIVKESLGMSIGKTAAQCAHASQMLQMKYSKLCEDAESYLPHIWESRSGDLEKVPLSIRNDVDIFYQWMKSSFRKVVLRAKDKEWDKIKEACPNHIVVVDAGLTEIPAGSETVIGLWTMRKSERPKIIQKLQVLK